MSTEAKVGAFTVVGLALLTLVLVHLSGFSWNGEKTYRYMRVSHRWWA